MIKVKFYGVLAKEMPQTNEEGFWVLEESGITVLDVLRKTNLLSSNIRFSTLVNGLNKPFDTVLKNGDVLAIMPLLAGG